MPLLGVAHCQQQNDKAALKLTSLDQVLELAEQPEGLLDFRDNGAVLMALEPQTRKSAFNQLIRCRREGLAVFVSDLAILDGDPEYASAIASAMPTRLLVPSKVGIPQESGRGTPTQ